MSHKHTIRLGGLGKLVMLGLVTGVVLLAGCSKPPPPAPPPPPPPAPPPPAEVTLASVAQDMKIDPRVQFTDGMTVVEEQLEMAKAIIKLADGFAKGNAAEVKPLLTRPAQDVLNELLNTGGWEEATKDIEAVRVVLVQDGIDLGGVGQATSTGAAELMPLITQKVGLFIATLTKEQQSAIGKAVTDAMAGVDPTKTDPAALSGEIMTKLQDSFRIAGVPDDKLDELKKIGEEIGTKLAGDAAAASGAGSSHGLLMAIQDRSGAYVLGWSIVKVGESWMFQHAPATPEVRARASSWDGVGPEGFQAVKVVAAPVQGEAPPAESSTGGGGGRDSGGGPSSPPPSGPSSPPPSEPSSPSGPGRPRGPG